jgi:hypothetical protein
MGSQQRSPLMLNEKYSRGPAVPDGLEAPSDRASLVIVLRNATTGQQAIWQRGGNHADPGDDHLNVSNAWLTTLLGWGVAGYPTT